MKEFTYTIRSPFGIHARPAALLVKEAKELSSTVTNKKGDKTAAADRLLSLMLLDTVQGDQVTVTLEGPEEEREAPVLEAFFRENL